MVQDRCSATVTRGPESWASIYIALGFTLSIEGTAISMVPLFPWNLAAYAAIAAITIFLFLNSGWFQNKLLSWKGKYEQKAR
ncbi:hypothetical protein [Bradyrhizobium sp. CCBAU 53421]|uniref:hypothetical protein n=1 Tax=Bradyrhizobium sp. CCBAU 53421 TaxID=1325120 RepID=UPI001889CD9F|nr:hypothetical protein [Bradyrhizobium sp. CCBAU 53421]